MTSKQTNEDIKKILDKYITPEVQVKLFAELATVKGNKSFTDTIINMRNLLLTIKK
jgi:hypothetical protein